MVIYDTKFGNTEKIARALARGVEKQGVKVDCVKAGEVDVDKLVEYDFPAYLCLSRHLSSVKLRGS